MTTVVDLRCDQGFRRLFGKLRLDGGKPVVTGDNLMEFACTDCRKRIESETGRRPSHVLHRFDLAGELIETEVVD